MAEAKEARMLESLACPRCLYDHSQNLLAGDYFGLCFWCWCGILLRVWEGQGGQLAVRPVLDGKGDPIRQDEPAQEAHMRLLGVDY